MSRLHNENDASFFQQPHENHSPASIIPRTSIACRNYYHRLLSSEHTHLQDNRGDFVLFYLMGQLSGKKTGILYGNK